MRVHRRKGGQRYHQPPEKSSEFLVSLRNRPQTEKLMTEYFRHEGTLWCQFAEKIFAKKIFKIESDKFIAL